MAWERLALIEAAKVSPETLTQVAKVFDYEKQVRDEARKPEGVATGKRVSDEPLNTPTTGKQKRSTGSFVRITKIEPLEREKEQSHDYLYDPKQQLKADDSTSGTYQFEAPRPLLTSAQLIPFLHNSLGLKHAGNKIDQRVLGRLVSKGQPIQKFPFKTIQRWSQQLQIIVDTGDHLRPYWKDFERIVELLKQVLGSNNVSAIRLRESTQRRQKTLCIAWPTEQGLQWQTWKTPAADVPVLILSDFGVTEKTGNHSGLWWRFAKELYFHPAPVITLSPVASAPVNRASCQRLSISPLKDGSSLPRHALRGFDHPTLSSGKIKAILILLSPLPIIDTGLLRKLRDAFQWGNSAVEGQLWNHPDMQVGSIGIRLKPSLAKAYAKQFRLEVSEQDAQKLWGVVELHHINAHQGLKQLELISQSVASGSDNEEVRSYLKKLSASTAQSIKGSAQHSALVMQCKTYLASQPDDIWNGELNDVFYDLCAMAYEADIKAGELPPMLGESFRPERLKWLLDDKERQEYVSWSVRQVGISGEVCFEPASTATEIASPVYRFEALKKIPPTLHMQDGSARSLYDGLVCKAEQLDSVEVRTESEVMHFDVMQKPDWAAGIGRDQYGLYADINLTTEHIQRFRWIPAGEFMMGETKSESVLRPKDTQRRVSIPDGFWFADTMVTQAQWQAIMNRRPSRFKGDNRPVEKVSWEDTQRFIERVNTKLSPLKVNLPSEENWEYACRAGTTTPFSFGNHITTEQVNYKGIYPYQHENTDLYRDDNGLYRKETVPVKSLPPNSWGLYEMHGNVAEYCQDYWKEIDNVTDPLNERLVTNNRVARGGAWSLEAKFVRSADRWGVSSDIRESVLGFRLCLTDPLLNLDQGRLKQDSSHSMVENWDDFTQPNGVEEKVQVGFPDIELQYDLADKALEKEDYESALSCLMYALSAQQGRNYYSGEAITSRRISKVFQKQGNYYSALEIIEGTLKRLQKSDVKTGEVEMLSEIAQIHLLLGQESKAMEYLQQSSTLAMKLDDEKGVAAAFLNMSKIYHQQRNYELALSYSEQAHNIIQRVRDEEGEVSSLQVIAKTYEEMGNYEKALECLDHAYSLMQKFDDEFGMASVTSEISQLYYKMGDYNSTQIYLEISYKKMQEVGDRKGLLSVLTNLSKLSVAQNKFSEALEYAESAKTVAEAIGSEELIKSSEDWFSELQNTIF